jgi:hypothetical protein
VSVRDFYVSRAAECLLASEQVSQSSDRQTLLHMAAAYISRVIEVEFREARGREVSALPPDSEPAQISS